MLRFIKLPSDDIFFEIGSTMEKSLLLRCDEYAKVSLAARKEQGTTVQTKQGLVAFATLSSMQDFLQKMRSVVCNGAEVDC